MPLSPETLLAESQLRRSYRKFLPEPVDRAVLETCLLTASTAPSGANKQPWHFCVVTDPEMKQRIREGSEAVEREFYAEHITDEWRADLAKLTLAVEKPFLTEAGRYPGQELLCHRVGLSGDGAAHQRAAQCRLCFPDLYAGTAHLPAGTAGPS